MSTVKFVLNKIIYHQFEHCINNIVSIAYFLYIFNKYVGPRYQKRLGVEKGWAVEQWRSKVYKHEPLAMYVIETEAGRQSDTDIFCHCEDSSSVPEWQLSRPTALCLVPFSLPCQDVIPAFHLLLCRAGLSFNLSL